MRPIPKLRDRLRWLLVVLSLAFFVAWQPPPYAVFFENQTSSAISVEVRFARYPATEPHVVAANTTDLIYQSNYNGGTCSKKPEIPSDMTLILRKGQLSLSLTSAQFQRVAEWEESRRWFLRVDEGGVGSGAARVNFTSRVR